MYNAAMKVLSLDLSSKSSGYAIFVQGKLVEYGTVVSGSKNFLDRGNIMADGIKSLVRKYGKFDKVVIEELKVLSNQKVLVVLGIVQGMVLRELCGSSVVFVPPTVWRKSFGLNGKREQAKEKAIRWCKMHSISVENDDEAEAICLGASFLSKTLDINLQRMV